MDTKLNTVEKAARVVAKNVFCVNQQHPPCDDCNVVGRVVCEDKGTTAVRAILTAWAEDPPECMVEALERRFGASSSLVDVSLSAAFQAALDEGQ